MNDSHIVDCGRDIGLRLSITTSTMAGLLILGNQEFQESLKICYALLPNNLPGSTLDVMQGSQLIVPSLANLMVPYIVTTMISVPLMA